MLGLTRGSYEAYCLDQACWYLGITLTEELNKAGQKRQKGEAQNEAARKRVLAKFLGEPSGGGKKSYADPAALFA